MITIENDMTILKIHNQQVELTEDEAYALYLELDKKYHNKDAINEITKKFLESMRTDDLKAFTNVACIMCSNNPKNGGSGICLCTLGLNVVSC